MNDNNDDEQIWPSVRMTARLHGVSPGKVQRERGGAVAWYEAMRQIVQRDPDSDMGRDMAAALRGYDGMSLGFDGKLRPNRRFDTRDRDERIRALRRDGKSIRAIAGDVGCSVGTVHRVIAAD